MLEQLMALYAASMHGRPIQADALADGLGRNPFEYQEGAMLTREDDNFFGPIGNLIAGFIPGLTSVDDTGRKTPILKTNFNWKPSGMSSFAHARMRSNKRVVDSALTSQQAGMAQSWGSLFGEGSVLDNMVQSLAPNSEMAEQGRAVLGMLGSPVVSQFAMPFMNSLLGYDRGVSANMANKFSNPLAAAYLSQRGRAGQVDPFGPEFEQLKKAFASNITSGVQNAMYDGVLKKDLVHGASENLVTQIMGDAFRSKDADKFLKDKGLSVDSVTKERTDIDTKISEITRKRTRTQQEYEEAEKRGDTSAMRQLKLLEDSYDKDLEQLSKQLEDLGKKIGEAMEPLIDSVTGVVDSLKDFYGSEEEAKQALDKLTGGKGSRDKAVADRVSDQMLDLKILSGMAGMDPRVAGRFLEENRQALASASPSRLATGSMYQGSMAMAFTNDFMKQIIGLGGDPRKAGLMMEAQTQSAKAYGNSETHDLSIMLEAARKGGTIDEETYDRVYRLLETGNYADLDRAKNLLGSAGFGSRKELERMRKNRSVMAQMESDLDEEATQRISTLGIAARNNELSRFSQRAAYAAGETSMTSALRESGVETREINDRVGTADFDAVLRTLENPFEGEDPNSDDFQRRTSARENLEKEFQAAYEKTKTARNPAGDIEKAKRMAIRNFQRKGYTRSLTREQQDQLFTARGESRKQAFQQMDYFQSGDVQQSGQNMFNALEKISNTTGMLKDKDGNEISRDVIQNTRRQYEEALSRGDTYGAQQALDQLKGILGGREIDQVNAEGGTIANSGNSTVFSDIGAANKGDGNLTRSAMTKAAKNVFTAARRMGDTLTDAYGNRIDRKVVLEREKQFKQLMKEGRFEEARELVGEFYNDLDQSSRDYVKDQASNSVYRTQEVIEKQNSEKNLIAKYAKDEKMGSYMGGLTADQKLVMAQYTEDARSNKVDAGKFKEAKERLTKALSEGSKDARGDMERIFKFIQTGDWEEAEKVFIASGHTKEEFFNLLQGAIEGVGGIVGDAKSTDKVLDEASKSTASRTDYLTKDTTGETDRLYNYNDEQNRKRLEVLSGRKVTDREARRYQEKLDKAKDGDRKSYLSALETEDKALAANEKELERKLESAKTPEERQEILKQLKGVRSERTKLESDIKDTKSTKDETFIENQEKAASRKRVQRDARMRREVSFETRMTGLSEDKTDSREYLEALAGRDLSDKEVESYQENLEKARKGDQKSLVRAMKAEDKALSVREKELKKELKNAKTEEERKSKETELKKLQDKRTSLQSETRTTEKLSRKEFREKVSELDATDAKVKGELLQQATPTFGDRLESSGKETAEKYLKLLGGEGVSEKDVERYRTNIEKAQKGDKSAYVKNLTKEQDLLKAQEKEVKEKLKSTSSKKEKEAYTEQLMGIEVQKGNLEKEQKRISKMSDKEFKQEVQKAKEEKEAEKKYGGLDKNVGELCRRIDKLCGILEKDKQPRGVS